MVYKNDYNALVKRVDNLMRQLGAEQDNYGTYYFDTDCGKMRVKVDDFKPKKNYLWIFTKVENPEKVSPCYRDRNDFNKFSGKHNMFSDDLNYMYHWLQDYIKSCISSANYREDV